MKILESLMSGDLTVRKPLVMGILNVTPNSFSDGGKFLRLEDAISAAGQMVLDGVDIIDVGGESTGPDSPDVSAEDELARVIPVVSALRERFPALCISVDTYKAVVAASALAAGADMINDVTALRGHPAGDFDGGVLADVIAKSGKPICLMYSKDSTPRTTRSVVEYDDVVATILDFFDKRMAFAKAHGIAENQILLDPGLGFFVSGEPRYSFEILDRLEEFQCTGRPILLGPSRKSFLGGALEDRLPGTIAACLKAASKGVAIVRVHDVSAVKKAISSESPCL